VTITEELADILTVVKVEGEMKKATDS